MFDSISANCHWWRRYIWNWSSLSLSRAVAVYPTGANSLATIFIRYWPDAKRQISFLWVLIRGMACCYVDNGIWFGRIYDHIDKFCQCLFNTLRPRQNGRHFSDDIFKSILLDENVWTSIKISLNYFPKGPIYNIPALGSDNGLAPTRRKAIIWTNDGWITDAYMRHSVSMS